MRKVLALIAHNSKKDNLVEMIQAHKEELAEVDLVATQGTGELIRLKTGLKVTLLHSGALGGDLQIGDLVAGGKVHSVIFYHDPKKTLPREPAISALQNICDTNDVPFATNFAAAEGVIHLLAEHPEALSGHHLAAAFLEEMAYKHD